MLISVNEYKMNRAKERNKIKELKKKKKEILKSSVPPHYDNFHI